MKNISVILIMVTIVAIGSGISYGQTGDRIADREKMESNLPSVEQMAEQIQLLNKRLAAVNSRIMELDLTNPVCMATPEFTGDTSINDKQEWNYWESDAFESH